MNENDKFVRIQVRLTGEQAKDFERLRAVFGLNKANLGGLMMVLGMRYLMVVVYPSETVRDDQVDRLVAAMAKAGVIGRQSEDDVSPGRKVRVRLVDGRVIEGYAKSTADSAVSSYGQSVLVVDGQAIDGWQILEIEDLD